MINNNPQKIVFLAINASFSHTNITALYFKEIAERKGFTFEIVESTSAENPFTLAIRLAEMKPNILCATFFLFNHLYLLSVLSRFKALAPDALILAGGPEFLGDNFAFLSKNKYISAVIRGEGEHSFEVFLEVFKAKELWINIPGLCCFLNEKYIDNGYAKGDYIPVPDYENILKDFKRPFLLIETSRGCKNSCSFCTSGKGDKYVKTLDLTVIKRLFTHLKNCGVHSIKLADRTFNDLPERYMPILKMMREDFHDINFHMEIDPARVVPALIDELAKARENQFHLEVGIQSLNPEVIETIGRACTAARSISGLQSLLAVKRHYIHTDLIAGLPMQTLSSLLDDLELLTNFAPNHIQLELLKLLPGSRLVQEAKKFGLIASPDPPYEVLRTSTMSEHDMQIAMNLSNLVDWYFNHPDLYELCVILNKVVPSFWRTFYKFYLEGNHFGSAPNIEKRFYIFAKFIEGCAKEKNLLMEKLYYFWLQAGLSPRCVPNIEQWRKSIPESAGLIKGCGKKYNTNYAFRVGEDTYIFSYCKEKKPAAIYKLQK